MSKLYSDGLEELRAGRARELLGVEADKTLDALGRAYLNQASRLLSLEDEGVFQFWDSAELERLLRSVGFADLRSYRSFGDPPQAIVVAAKRP